MNLFIIIAQFLCEKLNYKTKFVVVQRFFITVNAYCLCDRIEVPKTFRTGNVHKNHGTMHV